MPPLQPSYLILYVYAESVQEFLAEIMGVNRE